MPEQAVVARLLGRPQWLRSRAELQKRRIKEDGQTLHAWRLAQLGDWRRDGPVYAFVRPNIDTLLWLQPRDLDDGRFPDSRESEHRWRGARAVRPRPTAAPSGQQPRRKEGSGARPAPQPQRAPSGFPQTHGSGPTPSTLIPRAPTAETKNQAGCCRFHRRLTLRKRWMAVCRLQR